MSAQKISDSLRPRVFSAALALFWASCHVDTDTDFTALQQLEPLDPSRYAASITAVDEVIFRSGPLDSERREALAAPLRTLATQVQTREAGTAAAHFAVELRTLANLAEHLRADLPVEDSQLPDQWMRIRNSLFDDASWFARSEADLDRPPPGPDPMLVAPSTVTNLRGTLDKLADLARALPHELDELSVDEAAPWQESWRGRLAEVEAELPAEPPFPGNPFLVSATRRARAALETLGRLPQPGREWAGAERQAYLSMYERVLPTIAAAQADVAKINGTSDLPGRRRPE